MTVTSSQAHQAPPATQHVKGSRLFAPIGDGARRRRSTDVGKVVLALFLTLLFGLIVNSRERFQTAITQALHPPVFGLSWLFTSLWFVMSVGTMLMILAMVLVKRRWDVLRDCGIAAALALATVYGCQFLFGTSGNFNVPHGANLGGVDLGFPNPYLAVVASLTFVALPYLARNMQRLFEVVIFATFVVGLIDGAGLPFALLISIVVGWGAAAADRLIFGSPTGLPSTSQISALVAALGISVKDLKPSALQDWGLARYDATDANGQTLRVSLYGRDAEQSQFWSKVYRAAFYRNVSTQFFFTRQQQVDHECYMALVADSIIPGHAGVVVGSGMVGPDKDGLVVVKTPPGPSLNELSADQVSDAALDSLCQNLKALHDAGLAHQVIDPTRLYVKGDVGGISDFEQARNYATDTMKQRDVAALIVSMGMATNAERSVAAAKKVFSKEELVGTLGFLQSAALPTSLSTLVLKHHDKSLVKDLRAEGAKAAGVEEPKLVEMKRFSWTNLILAVGTLIGGWALIGVFFHVAQSFSTIKQANPVWVVITAVIAQAAYFGSALSTMGSILSPMPYFPVVILELSNTFSGLALGTPAVLAARVRFFQQHGVDGSLAVSSGVLVSTASWIVKGGLFLISIPFAISTFHFTGISGKQASGKGTDILIFAVIVLVAVGAIIAIVFAVPRWRKLVKAKLVPKFKEVVDHFKILIRQPLHLFEIFGGMVIAQLVIAFALGTSLHCFNHSLSLPAIIVVLTIGSMLGGVSPVPGGMGVVEAGMILGLKAAGIPDDVAISAVFIQRLFTAYLPPVAGWFALMWLRRKDLI